MSTLVVLVMLHYVLVLSVANSYFEIKSNSYLPLCFPIPISSYLYIITCEKKYIVMFTLTASLLSVLLVDRALVVVKLQTDWQTCALVLMAAHSPYLIPIRHPYLLKNNKIDRQTTCSKWPALLAFKHSVGRFRK